MRKPEKTAAPSRISRHIKPLGMRVLVRILRGEDRTESGLFLPPGAKERLQEALYGEVLEVARAESDEPEDGLGTNISGIPCGSRILFPKSAGTAVPWDEGLRLLEVKDVLATVEEVDLEHAH
ncbi:MAG: co-chaperone GroES [Deltaproteobacteria bacterium]|nr:co-chaperone GroES [Deltaproteobacteria bacterium]